MNDFAEVVDSGWEEWFKKYLTETTDSKIRFYMQFVLKDHVKRAYCAGFQRGWTSTTRNDLDNPLPLDVWS